MTLVEEVTLVSLGRALAEARRRAKEADETVAAAEADFRAAFAALFDERKAAQEACDALEVAVRNAVVDTYRETGDTRPAAWASVKHYTRLVYDSADALAWAKAHGLALALDRREFEAVIRKVAEPPRWLTVETEPRAAIATDLDKALGVEVPA